MSGTTRRSSLPRRGAPGRAVLRHGPISIRCALRTREGSRSRLLHQRIPTGAFGFITPHGFGWGRNGARVAEPTRLPWVTRPHPKRHSNRNAVATRSTPRVVVPRVFRGPHPDQPQPRCGCLHFVSVSLGRTSFLGPTQGWRPQRRWRSPSRASFTPRAALRGPFASVFGSFHSLPTPAPPPLRSSRLRRT